jgi:predicted metalloprotease
MRFGGRRTSDNVEFREGGRGGMGLGGGGMGGGAGMLMSLVFSRFGIGGVVVLFLIMMFLGGSPLGLSGSGEQAASPQQRTNGQSAAQVCGADAQRQFMCQVLASSEDQWTELFRASGQTYRPPRLVFYQGGAPTGCGYGQSAMGPFYCPADQGIFLDTTFFNELSQRLGAPGDFAQAYVVAHEVGHHVQTLMGTANQIRQAQQAAGGEADSNALQVRMELQADCYAGVWASRERSTLEPGDVEEGMTAAAAIGDDTLQRAGRGQVVPESFTHGTSAQRQDALMRGFNGGNPAACDVYTQGI